MNKTDCSSCFDCHILWTTHTCIDLKETEGPGLPITRVLQPIGTNVTIIFLREILEE